jgi:hypothetical protein
MEKSRRDWYGSGVKCDDACYGHGEDTVWLRWLAELPSGLTMDHTSLDSSGESRATPEDPSIFVETNRKVGGCIA